MSPAITFEHASATSAILAGVALVIGLAGFWFWRYLSVRGADLGLLALRVGFLLLLGWCLLRPSTKIVEQSVLKPRLVVLVDASTSMLRAPEEKIPTRWAVAQEILGADWLKNLTGQAEVEGCAFAAELGAKSAAAELARLTPAGPSTRLRAALQQVAERYRGQPLAGILLLSDGIDTLEADEGWVNEEWPCPIFAVRLEPPVVTEEIPPDVRVVKVDTPRRVVVGWESKLTAVVSGQGTKGEPFTVQLLENDTVIQELPTQLPADGATREVSFQLPHPAVGSFTYTVNLVPLPGEALTNDNAFAVGVQVVDTKNRLLYVEGTPRFESKFLTRALQANQSITPLVFLQGPNRQFLTVGQRGSMTTDLTADQLTQFKIVILGDLDAESLGDARATALLKFVEDGGSLVLLGGPKAWGAAGFAGTALTKLLPVRRPTAQPAREGRFPVRLTAEGRAHAAFTTDSAAWENAPPVLSVFPGSDPTPGAATLAETTSGDSIVVAQRFGQGKVAAVLTDSLWRWQLEPGKGDSYARFWNQMIEWLKPAADELQPYELDLFADTDQVFLGEKIALRARLGGRDEPLPAGLPVTCAIHSAAEERALSFPMVAQPVTTSAGRTFPGFGVEFTAQSPGLHTVVATVEIDGRKIESPEFSFFVKAFTPENSPQPARHDLLQALTAASGGRYVAPDELAGVLAQLELTGRAEERSVYSTLWNSWWVLACLVGLLTVEWSVRKMRNLA